jgi:DTW domain-containing protein
VSRQQCIECDRPKIVCLCPWLVKIQNEFSLLILRHKSEASHALNTVKILSRMLQNIRVVDGEEFDQSLINFKLHQPYLLFPSDESVALIKNRKAEESSRVKLLVVIDGSWRKARKILFLNPWLEQLPKISFKAKESHYLLRKKSAEGVSTLEAVKEVLAGFESNDSKYEPLLKCMNQMQQFQIDIIGDKKFQKHFGSRL